MQDNEELPIGITPKNERKKGAGVMHPALSRPGMGYCSAAGVDVDIWMIPKSGYMPSLTGSR
jgi:hypothetical protein